MGRMRDSFKIDGVWRTATLTRQGQEKHSHCGDMARLSLHSGGLVGLNKSILCPL